MRLFYSELSKTTMNLLLGDCLEKLKELEDNSVDAIVTDPPYGLSFMGKKWDYDVPSVNIWKECLRVLKPGGYLLAFAGTRTQHRMAVNIEDAGFEIRDMIAWCFGQGFPKSLNIGKAVDRLQGNEREDLGVKTSASYPDSDGVAHYKNRKQSEGSQVVTGGMPKITKGNSEWEGWGTALKPALEPITVARKPLEKGLNVAENCLKWGVGGINIDGCRVETTREDIEMSARSLNNNGVSFSLATPNKKGTAVGISNLGRFPANLIHDGSEEVVGLFPQTKPSKQNKVSDDRKNNGNSMFIDGVRNPENSYSDSGSAARFFYTAKASKRERNIGCEELEEKQTWASQEKRESNSFDVFESDGRPKTMNSNNHPTVKPLSLMEYLVKLVSREGQVVLDPFMGSGTTGMACKKLNRDFIGIEMMPEYMEIAKCRIDGTKEEN